MELPKMRTAPQLAAEYKQADPNTSVNTYFLRRLILDGKIPYVKAGKKYLISADNVAQYLAIGQTAKEKPQQSGIIRELRA